MKSLLVFLIKIAIATSVALFFPTHTEAALFLPLIGIELLCVAISNKSDIKKLFNAFFVLFAFLAGYVPVRYLENETYYVIGIVLIIGFTLIRTRTIRNVYKSFKTNRKAVFEREFRKIERRKELEKKRNSNAYYNEKLDSFITYTSNKRPLYIYD